jgi:hypothetical protein
MGFLVIASLPPWGIGSENCKRRETVTSRKETVKWSGPHMER